MENKNPWDNKDFFKNHSELNEEKVNSQVKKSIEDIRKKIYPQLTDNELRCFNNKLSKFLFF